MKSSRFALFILHWDAKIRLHDSRLILETNCAPYLTTPSSIIYNQFLTLAGIPAETYEYRLGNRSALEWIVDQYQVSTDKRSSITNDPNREDDPTYILRLIGEVITVSLETVSIVRSLPPLAL